MVERIVDTLEMIGRKDHSKSNEYLIFGPPGTGKTTSAKRQIHRAVDRFGESSVMVTSFSRAAAIELMGRDVPIALDRIGTLHSRCFHALGKPLIAEAHVEEWNRENPRFPIKPVSRDRRLEGEDSTVDEDPGLKQGDRLLQQLNCCRGRMLAPDKWPAEVREFATRWGPYKTAHGLLDFSDLIDTAVRDLEFAPNRPAVIIADEAQDLNPMHLALLRKWSKQTEYLVLAGDDDQCQPPGTLVRTSTGDIPIEALDCVRHRLVVFARCDGQLRGERHPRYRFQKASRHYEGPLLRIRAGEKLTRCTPDHRLLVRWVNGEDLKHAHVVYLMRRGEQFRVGWCKLIRADGAFHLGHRSRLEGADAAWILKVFLDRTEASIYESYVAARYGLPLATFAPPNGAAHYTEESLGRLFGMLKGYLPPRAAECLCDHGRDPRFPLYSPDRAAAKRGGSTTFMTEAANLLSGLMAVPAASHGQRVDWSPVEVATQLYSGPVYSLAVEKHHTYVADGVVVHNCIYGWAGASPEGMLLPEIPDDHKYFLGQSQRVPRAVHAFAEQLIHRVGHRQQKAYRPRAAAGEVKRLSGGYKSPEFLILKTIERHLGEGRRIMLLGSCAYMLQPILRVLRKEAIPFHNPYRKSNGFWNPLRASSRKSAARRIGALLVAHAGFGAGHHMWRGGELALWTEWLPPGMLTDRGPGLIAALPPMKEVALETLEAVFPEHVLTAIFAALRASTPAALLDWWKDRVAPEFRKRIQFPANVAARRGQSLLDTPRVIVGTIHSVKGGEADVVYLFPDLSPAGEGQYRRRGAQRDSVIRQFYVGATRARETLYLCSPESGSAIPI